MATETLTAAATVAPADPRGGLLSRSFLGLLATQFLGAFNDNMFRWLIVPIGKHYYGGESEALALAVGLAAFVLPYVLLAAPAGYLADRFSKRQVMIWCKVAEIAIVIAGVAAIYAGSTTAMFVLLMVIGSQSALFGPSKFGSIPEIVRPEKLSAANGLIGLTTILAIVLGSIAGGYLFLGTGPTGQTNLWISATALIGVAVVGWLTSLGIGRLAPANPAREFPWNPARQTFRDLGLLCGSVSLVRVALGTAFFWSLASLANLNVDAYACHELGLEQHQVGPLLAAIALGVGVGNLLAGYWSRGRVELGLVPLGALGMATGSFVLFFSTDSYGWSLASLFVMGASGGLFDVPLQAYLQERSPAQSRGAMLAASNLLTFLGTLLVSGLFYLVRGPLGLSAGTIFLGAGLLSLAVALYALKQLVAPTIRFLIWLVSRVFYRLRVRGLENVPTEGGAVLVANHVSWIDAVLVVLSSGRPVRMLGYADYIQRWPVRWLADAFGAIPIRPGSGRVSIMRSLATARDAVRAGELVCVFPEGGLTRNGQLQAFKPGVMSILAGTGAPLIPVYLDGLWGSIFSNRGGRFFWKWPSRWPFPVTITYGHRLEQPKHVHQIRRAVQDLGAQSMQDRQDKDTNLLRLFVRNCRNHKSQPKAADTTGQEVNGANLLLRSLIFRRLLLREILGPDEKYVGLLLPPSVGAVLANVAVPLAGRVAVNLNYSASSEVIDSCIRQCNIKHVLTSRRVMQRLNIKVNAELIYLEDFITKVTKADKLIAAAMTYAMPLAWLEHHLGVNRIKPDDVLTVLFTSGSTGEPKGVMLTYQNVGSNVQAIDEIVHLTTSDTAVGILPFFHSYGYTATMWTMLALAPKGVYHFSPLEAQQVGELSRKHRANILMATPTFLRSYIKRCQPEDFASLDVVFASAERLPADVSDAFERKFGVRPSEAYGATELAPLACLNVPDSRSHGASSPGTKEGSVGRPIPGVTAKIVHPETGEDLGIDEPGMLLFKGPNVMAGYLDRPDLTSKVIRDGWYVTGDIAKIDEDGFVTITGRQSRFSKIGGEMVPHIKIEETIAELLKSDEELKAAVTAVSDPKRGERIVVLHLPLDRTPEEIYRQLTASGLPKLWIPSPDSFVEVEELPILGSGKLDLKALKEMAMDRFGATTSA
ncbi:MAG: MFS transporter [Pirellulales bacterium]|nr:MFS transporter [Pirellulales bacterium]